MQNIFTDNAEMLRIGLNDTERKRYENQKASYNKRISRLLKQARENSKADACYVCRQPCSSFCNSHSIPQFCLKHLSKDGKVYPSVWNSGVPLLDREVGIKGAGTFQLICRDCDSKVFQEYETPEAYSTIPDGKVLAQICMKDYLHMISKKRQKIELDKLEAEITFSPITALNDIYITELDLCEYESGYERAYQALHGNHGDWYYLCYFQKLDYVVPFAFQGLIALVCDLNGNIINDTYNMSPDYHLQEIHMAVFPLEAETVIMMIIDSRQKRYRKFYRQLKKLPLDDQLAVINYIIFGYSENVFISKDVSEDVFADSNFLKICQTTNLVVSHFPTYNRALDKSLEAFDLSRRNDIPNLLSPKYALDHTK